MEKIYNSQIFQIDMKNIVLPSAFQNKWMELFPSIISRAKTLQVVHSEVSGHASGSIHLVISCFFLDTYSKFLHLKYNLSYPQLGIVHILLSAQTNYACKYLILLVPSIFPVTDVCRATSSFPSSAHKRGSLPSLLPT